MSVDRLIRSVTTILDTFTPPDLAELCPRLAVVGPAGDVPALAVTVDDDGRPHGSPGERVLLRGVALVRVHAAVDAVDGRPLRQQLGPQARLLALAAGAGPLVASAERLVGVLRATADRPALAYSLAWSEVDDVAPASTGGVVLLSTSLLGALTLDLLR